VACDDEWNQLANFDHGLPLTEISNTFPFTNTSTEESAAMFANSTRLENLWQY